MSTEIKAQNTTTLASVKEIYYAAEQANDILDDMNDAATAAHTTLTGIYADAEQAASDAASAKESATNASEYAARALGNLSSVQSVAETLNWITAHGTMTNTQSLVPPETALNPSHVYFVVDANGDYEVGGTRYSVVTEPDVADIASYYVLSIDESLNNYVATHLAVDGEGLWIVPDSGGNKVLIAVGGAGHTYSTAGTYIIGKVGGVDTVFAQFTTNGMTTNATSGTQIAHLGYGLGNNDHGGTSNAPYYSFGERQQGSTKGNYSVGEGYRFNSSGWASHAEGYYTEASGLASHAEGDNTMSRGEDSHAEGYNSLASGLASHAQNYKTIAQRKSQTAIGEWNVEDTTGADGTVRGNYSLIIGNGTANNARSNALTVDWSGNVDIASGAKYKINGTALAASDVGAEPTLTNINESGGTYSGGIEDEKLLTTATITKWQTILGI